MNGSTNPLLDKEDHVLKLGESFEKRPKSLFHTIRCKCQQRIIERTMVKQYQTVLHSQLDVRGSFRIFKWAVKRVITYIVKLIINVIIKYVLYT